MIRAWLATAAAGGFASVAAGAAAAHLAARDVGTAELLRTAALYGMVHAASLLGVAALAERREQTGAALAVAGWGFALGLPLFSLSLIALAATGLAVFGRVTPFGGIALLAGWLALGVDALRRR
jgi:uncharacterized membrane protein YgdD (TMEM256/DUF423 family)